MYRKMYNFEIVQVSNINILTSTAKRNTTHKLRSMDYDFRLDQPQQQAAQCVHLLLLQGLPLLGVHANYVHGSQVALDKASIEIFYHS